MDLGEFSINGGHASSSVFLDLGAPFEKVDVPTERAD